MDLFEQLEALAGSDGWWTEEGHDSFIESAKKLQLLGMGDEEIYEMLERLYFAVAAEFGN